jgi:membrane-bound lytic murein transglycosylase D
VTINYSVSLRLVSDITGAPFDELTALNPSLLRMTTPPDAAFDLHLPGGMAAVYEQRIAAVPESRRNAWRYHRVAADDTLATVARTYRVPVDQLAAVNQMQADDSIQGVEALVIPAAQATEPSAHVRLYTARRGETLVTIADRFGVSLTDLRNWNKIAGIKVQAGQRLRVADPAVTPQVSTHGRHHGHSQEASKTQKVAQAKGSALSETSKGSAASANEKSQTKRSTFAAHEKKTQSSNEEKPRGKRSSMKSKKTKAK